MQLADGQTLNIQGGAGANTSVSGNILTINSRQPTTYPIFLFNSVGWHKGMGVFFLFAKQHCFSQPKKYSMELDIIGFKLVIYFGAL